MFMMRFFGEVVAAHLQFKSEGRLAENGLRPRQKALPNFYELSKHATGCMRKPQSKALSI